ncbi:hypothetical protein ACFQ0G_04770 [Streptomyces chiangmaiensis]
MHAFPLKGVRPLRAAHRALIGHLGGIDALVLVDGGTGNRLIRVESTAFPHHGRQRRKKPRESPGRANLARTAQRGPKRESATVGPSGRSTTPGAP